MKRTKSAAGWIIYLYLIKNMLNQRCGETVIAVGFGRRTKRALYLSHSDLSNETVVFI